MNHDRQIMPSFSNFFDGRIQKNLANIRFFSECVCFCVGRHLMIGDFFVYVQT